MRSKVWLGLVLLVGAGLAVFWSMRGSLPEVRVQEPRRGDLEARFLASGRVEADTLPIASRSGGLVKTVEVEENEAVRRGQVLATLNDAEARARVDSTRAALDQAVRQRGEIERRLALVQGQGRAAVEAARAEHDKARWEYEATLQGSPEDTRKARAALDEAEARLGEARTLRQRAEQLFAEDIASREEVDRARTAEEVARAQRDQARMDLEKARQGASREAREAARAAMEAAGARVDQAEQALLEADVVRQQLEVQNSQVRRLEADLEAAVAALDHVILKAPYDGIVSQVLLMPGELEQGHHPVLTLVRPDRLRIEASVDEQDAAFVSRGQEVTVRFPALPGEGHPGRVTRVAPALERPEEGSSSTRSLRIQVELAKPVEGLRPGLEADVEGRAVLVRDALLVPRSALRTRDGRDVVLAVRDGRLAEVPVEAGGVTPEQVAVASGLDPTARVVVEPEGNLREGDRVRVR